MQDTVVFERLGEFNDLVYELFDGILGNKELGQRYKHEKDFRAFVDSALNLYDSCKKCVFDEYGREGQRVFIDAVASEVDAIRQTVYY